MVLTMYCFCLAPTWPDDYLGKAHRSFLRHCCPRTKAMPMRDSYQMR